MNNFLQRILVSSIVIAILAFLLYFSNFFLIRLLIALLVGFLSAIAVWEFSQFAHEKGAILPVSILVFMGGLISFSFALSYFAPVFFFVLSVLVLFALHFRKISNALTDLSLSIFGLLYIAVPLGMLLTLLSFPDGVFWIIYLVAVTKSADVGGYVGGTLLGKKKLAPKISPSKTLEGAIVGLFCSVTVSYFLAPFLYFTSLEAVLLGLILGAVSIFSDLSESLLKRDAGKKDSNHLPGLGGVLDLIDSLLFTTPILYLYARL